MERPANSKVRHGMPSCARYGCQREECLEALRKRQRENERDLKDGRKARVSIEASREHVRRLMLHDMPPVDIAKKSGVSEQTVHRILQKKFPRIHWIIEDAILGVPLPEGDWRSSSDGMICAIGAARRLRALGVQGFSRSILVNEAGIDKNTIQRVRAYERTRITISVNRSVRELHDRLYDSDPFDFGMSAGDITRVRRHAERQGWFPTEAWEDIDDPDCIPRLKTPRYISLTEDARELMREQGYTHAAAAERLGVTADTLKAAVRYYDQIKAKAIVQR